MKQAVRKVLGLKSVFDKTRDQLEEEILDHQAAGRYRGRLPLGYVHLYRLADRLKRYQRRGKRPRKPAPRGRAELVARQKKARPRVGNYSA